MGQKRRFEGVIDVEEIHDIIEQGTTMPVRCRLKNGMDVIVKYMRNPAGQQALINEWIGSNIADLIGMTIPEYGICNLTESVISQTNENEEIDIRNSGYAFYTKEYSKTIPIISRGILYRVVNHETELIMLFDHIVNNHDRHEGNLLCDISKGATLLSIDNSHIITEEPKRKFVFEEAINPSHILSDSIINTNRSIYEMLNDTVGFCERRIRSNATEIKRALTHETLVQIKNSIPTEWGLSIGTDKVNQMFEVIEKRISLLDEIAEKIIEERSRF